MAIRFLGDSGSELALRILTRRDEALATRIRQSTSVSRSDAAGIVSTLSDELNDNLDADWEPTEYGRQVSELLARVNARRVAEWPD